MRTRELKRAAILCLGLIWLAGCGASQYAVGRKLLDQEQYGGAAEVLEKALRQDPGNADILVALAEALYHQERLDEAMANLQRARELDPGSSQAVLLVGLVHEKRGELDQAIAAYRSYTEISRLSRARKIIKARLDRLIREQVRQQTQLALEREEGLDVAAIPENTVAVAPFRNLGTRRELDPLQKGLAAMMITDLSKVEELEVVERLRTDEMLREMRLDETGLVEAGTAPRLGKLLGASRVISGSYADLADEQLRLDISVAGVEMGEVEGHEVSGPLERLFRLQKELTFGIVEEMGIELTQEQRDAIQRIPTENMLAFIAYARGLDLEDQGKAGAAAAAYQEAISLDPQFGMAQEQMESVEEADIGRADLDNVEEEVLPKKKPGGEGGDTGGTTGSETLGRLGVTGANTGAGFIATTESNEDVRKPVEEVETSGPQTTRVRIEVSIP